jgi:hypothetical protein
MSRDPDSEPDLVSALIEAAEAGDTQRMDEVLDLLRLRAEYDELIAEIVASLNARDYSGADKTFEALRRLPTFESFSASRSTTN